jgi:hypothetical protein
MKGPPGWAILAAATVALGVAGLLLMWWAALR